MSTADQPRSSSTAVTALRTARRSRRDLRGLVCCVLVLPCLAGPVVLAVLLTYVRVVFGGMVRPDPCVRRLRVLQLPLQMMDMLGPPVAVLELLSPLLLQ